MTIWEAIDLIFNNANSGERYNIGGENEISNIELIKLIYQIFSVEKNHDISFINDRHGHDRRYSISNKKIYKDLNFKLKYKFKNSLANLINEIKDNYEF